MAQHFPMALKNIFFAFIYRKQLANGLLINNFKIHFRLRPALFHQQRQKFSFEVLNCFRTIYIIIILYRSIKKMLQCLQITAQWSIIHIIISADFSIFGYRYMAYSVVLLKANVVYVFCFNFLNPFVAQLKLYEVFPIAIYILNIISGQISENQRRV